DRYSILAGERRAVERLKASLFGTDPYVRRKYIRDYNREFLTYRSLLSREELVEACEAADVVFVGDYHALPSCQGFATQLLTDLASRRRPVVLFLERAFAGAE